MKVPQDLKRYPRREKELLQAWDAADELILKNLNEKEISGRKVLILNDQFGALSSALMDFDITVYSDSYLSTQGIRFNSQNRIEPLYDLEGISGQYDLVLIRIPKNMSFFEDELCQLTRNLKPGSKIICGYMTKHQAKSSFDLLEKYVGKTHTSLSEKKARLIFAEFQRGPSISKFPQEISIPSFDQKFLNYSNVFSREKLDMGTRFLLEHVPTGNFKTVLDLGCANGVIGIAAKKTNPDAEVLFSDESWMAIKSAQINYQRHFKNDAKVFWTNCFENLGEPYLNLVLCNPPFHQGTLVGTSVAWEMFRAGHRALVEGGLMRIIGNNHLQYSTAIKKIFGNCRVIAKNSKFTVMDGIKKR